VVLKFRTVPWLGFQSFAFPPAATNRLASKLFVRIHKMPVRAESPRLRRRRPECRLQLMEVPCLLGVNTN